MHHKSIATGPAQCANIINLINKRIMVKATFFESPLGYLHRTWGDNNERHENMFYITDLQPF